MSFQSSVVWDLLFCWFLPIMIMVGLVLGGIVILWALYEGVFK